MVQTKTYPARNSAAFESRFCFRWAFLRTRARTTSRLTPQFHGDQSAWDLSASDMDPCRPFAHHAHTEGLQASYQRDSPTVRVVQGQGLRVHTNQDRATLPHDMVDPRRGSVGPVAQQEIPAADRDPAERLAPVDIGQLEEVALQVGQIDDIMDTPIRARRPLFLDGRGVDGPGAIPGVDDRRRGSVPQLLRQPPQPLFGGLEPLEYGDR